MMEGLPAMGLLARGLLVIGLPAIEGPVQKLPAAKGNLCQTWDHHLNTCCLADNAFHGKTGSVAA